MTNIQHKFVGNTSPNTYGVKIWCEYCGLIIYDGNVRDQRKYDGGHGPCPNTPVKSEQGKQS